jgi:hypothetical protein
MPLFGATGSTSTRGGKRIRFQKPLGVRDWQVAQLKARDMAADGVDAYMAGEKEALTVKKATDDFEIDVKNLVKASTLKQYKILLARLNAHFKPRGYVFLKTARCGGSSRLPQLVDHIQSPNRWEAHRAVKAVLLLVRRERMVGKISREAVEVAQGRGG